MLPASNVGVHRVADLDLDVAAIFDPFGNAVHTALRFPVQSMIANMVAGGRIAMLGLPADPSSSTWLGW